MSVAILSDVISFVGTFVAVFIAERRESVRYPLMDSVGISFWVGITAAGIALLSTTMALAILGEVI